MANVKFIHEGCETATFLASEGTNVLFDIDSLANRNPNSKWRSATTTGIQTMRIVFPVERSVDTVVIDGHNLKSLGDIPFSLSIEYSATSGLTWTEASSTEYSSYAERQGIPAIIKLEITSVISRYWRVKLYSGVSFGAAPEFGNIFLGTRFELSIPYNPTQRAEKFTTSVSRSLDGTPYGSQSVNDGIEGWKGMKWGNVDDTIANGFIRLNSSVRGSLRAFYFFDLDETVRLVMLIGDTIVVSPKQYNINDVALELQAFATNTMGAI